MNAGKQIAYRPTWSGIYPLYGTNQTIETNGQVNFWGNLQNVVLQ